MEPSKTGTPSGRQGPQGTQFFSKEDLDRLIANAVTEPPKGVPVGLRGASESVAGRMFALEQPRVLIGRASRCDIVINDPSVSAEHARLTRDGDDWHITNLLSTNGTFVNGKRSTTTPLRHGDRVRVGRIEFVFERPDGGSGNAVRERASNALLLGGLALAFLVIAAAVGWWLLG